MRCDRVGAKVVQKNQGILFGHNVSFGNDQTLWADIILNDGIG
jgi:ribosomal protein L27